MKNRIYLQGFSDGMPFNPTCKEVIYLPFEGSEVLDSFFDRNLEKVKRLFQEKLQYEFIYIPDVVKKFRDLDTLRYYHPMAAEPSEETITFVETELLNKHLHNADGKALKPALVHFMQTELLREFEGEHRGCFEFSYFPIAEGDDQSIMVTLQDYVEHCGESYCHINYGHPEIGQYSEADRSFYYAQRRYFEQFEERDISGITRYIVDTLAGGINEVSHMFISKDGEIYLPDFNIKIDMCPVVNAMYLLFLRHPEGIVFANMPTYTEELALICEQLNIKDENDLQMIALGLCPDLDFVDQFCGEMYVKFREHMDIKAAAHYIMQAAPYDLGKGNRIPYMTIGKPKKITLDRSLVSWHEDFIPREDEVIKPMKS